MRRDAEFEVDIIPSEFTECAFELLKGLSSELAAQAKNDKGEVSTKRDGSLVTEMDRRVEARLVSEFSGRFPGVPILGEEGAIDLGVKSSSELYLPFLNSHQQIVIDPIDGTRNFIEGKREYCMAVALCERTDSGIWPVGAVVVIPEFNEAYLADERGVFIVNLQSGARHGVTRCVTALAKISVNSRDRAWLATSGLEANLPWVSSGSSIYDFLCTSIGRLKGSIIGAQRLWDLMAPLAIADRLGLVLRDLTSGEQISGIGFKDLSPETESRPWGLNRRMVLALPDVSIGELVRPVVR